MSKSTRRAAARKTPARRKSVRGRTAKSRTTGTRQVAAAPPPPAAPAPDPFHLQLDASCTLRESGDLQFSLVAANGDPLLVDGGGVERIDTAGLQLLVALVRRQTQAGRRLIWKAASPALLKCTERLGLSEALGLAAMAAGETP